MIVSELMLLGLVRAKAKWIGTKQSEYKSASPAVVRPTFQEGSTLPYLGVNYPFRIVNDHQERTNNGNVELMNDVFLIFFKGTKPSTKYMKYIYYEWLVERAQSIFDRKSKVYSTELGIYDCKQ